MQNKLGHHLLVEFYNCNAHILNHVAQVEEFMNQAALACGATIVQSTFHHFNPYGVSGVVVIAESHLAIHTWPEYRYASVDLYTCGDTINPMVAYNKLKEDFQAEMTEVREIHRGDLDLILNRLSEFNVDQKEDAALHLVQQGVSS